MYFSRFAQKVTLLLRGDSLARGMSQYLIDEIGATDNIQVWTKTEVQETERLGNDSVRAGVFAATDRRLVLR